MHTETRWLFPLRRLSLKGHGYGLTAVRCVAEKLGAGYAPQLRQLSFNGSAAHRQLCDQGAAALGAAIATGRLPLLEDLDLQNSSMTSAGEHARMQSLLRSPTDRDGSLPRVLLAGLVAMLQRKGWFACNQER